MALEKGTIKSRSSWKFIALVALLVTVAGCTSRLAAEPAISSRESDEVVHRVDTDDPVVFLTIDDGATRDPKMVEVLKGAEVEATLFLTAQYVQEDVGFFRRLRDETGAVIENHTLDHPDLADESLGEQRRQICETSDEYAKKFGRRPTLLRPPYGSFDDDTLRAAAECGVAHVVHWSAVIENGRIQFAVGDRLRRGDIVLMHFTDQFRDDVERFVAAARKAGLEPALLEDYLN